MHVINNKIVADEGKRFVKKYDKGELLGGSYVKPASSIVIRLGKQVGDFAAHAANNYIECTSEEMQKLFEEYEKELREAQAEEVSTEQDS